MEEGGGGGLAEVKKHGRETGGNQVKKTIPLEWDGDSGTGCGSSE